MLRALRLCYNPLLQFSNVDQENFIGVIALEQTCCPTPDSVFVVGNLVRSTTDPLARRKPTGPAVDGKKLEHGLYR